jgi:hypothetical protein
MVVKTVRTLLWICVWIAAIGLALSLWVHIGAVMGFTVAPFALFVILHVGIFVVWIPAVQISKTARPPGHATLCMDSSDTRSSISFYLSATPARVASVKPSTSGLERIPGHWMAFYSAALLILYSAALKNVSVRALLDIMEVPL